MKRLKMKIRKFNQALLLLLLVSTPLTIEHRSSSGHLAQIPFSRENQKGARADLSQFMTRLQTMNFANADTVLARHPINNLRDSIGLVLGYGDHIAYRDLACSGSDPGVNTDCSNAPPYNGIVGRVTDILNTLPAIGAAAGIQSCAEVPASGSATGTDGNGNSITLNFQAPTHTVPSPWENGTQPFQKRVVFQESLLGDTTKIAYEFNCGDSPAFYAAINMDMGTIDGHAYKRLITLYSGPVNSSKKAFEVYMAEYSAGASRLRGVDAVRIEYTPSTNKFRLWGIMNTNLVNSDNIVVRTTIAGDYTTGIASVFYNGFQTPNLAGNDSAIDVPSVTGAGSLAAASDLSNGAAGSPSHDFTQDLTTAPTHTTPGEVFKRGCVNFKTPNTAPATNAECAGLALAAATGAPYADSGGAFTLQWALTALPGSLEVIP